MKSKEVYSLLKFYDGLNLKNFKIFIYNLKFANHAEVSKYYYSTFSEAVSDASVEALKISEMYDIDVHVWIYSNDYSVAPYDDFKAMKSFIISTDI